ncbi:hypothetical protein F5J12DRAFT_787430 [Pisolithus orientalis]|uniref:uncharacterized protein n=1 Tax=Pisolithus orientalis TaxID=936130 RepID=UPI002224DC54|nr:uncharacterized protein F5J12DRAFT_787430 [Pisolithus orientalis]KAI5985227.1 hypothetical protein F5J12DRAFT_787430 [Pisolithus orientalis]
MPFDATLNRHLVWAANTIARELGTTARNQYGAACQGLQLVNMLNFMEPFIGSQLHPSHQSVVEMGILYLECWIEVASNQLNSLILVTVSCTGYTPPLPACYYVYLRHQHDGVNFCHHMQLIPLTDPHSNFTSPWWLYCSEEYQVDSQRLQGKELFSAARDFFKLMMAQGLWPLPEVPITDHFDGHIKEQVKYYIKNISKYADLVNTWVKKSTISMLGVYDAHPLALSTHPSMMFKHLSICKISEMLPV